MTPRDQIVATMAKIDTHAQEGGNILEKLTYIAKELKSAALFIQKKMDMASDISESFNQYIGKHTELEEIESHLLLSEISHRDALEVATNTRDLHQILTNKVRNFGLTLPTDIEVRGVNLLVGREQKRVELEEILNHVNENSPQLSLFCQRMPITKQNEENFKKFYEADLRVINLIKKCASDNEDV